MVTHLAKVGLQWVFAFHAPGAARLENVSTSSFKMSLLLLRLLKWL